MAAADRFRNDVVDQLEREQVLRGQLERVGGGRGLGGIAPQDGGAAFRRDHRVDRVLQHRHHVAGGERDRAARAALTDHGGDDRHRRRQERVDRARDRFRLAARFRFDAGKRADRVDERQDRQAEPGGELHQAARLAVALGLGHAEIVADAGLGVAAALDADRDHRLAFEAPEPAHHGPVVGEGAVAGERRPVGEQAAEIVERARTLRVARDLRLLPGREFRIGRPELPISLLGQPGELVGDVDPAFGIRHPTELVDLALQFGDRLLEVEEVTHGRGV